MLDSRLPPHIARLKSARPIYSELPGVNAGYADLEVTNSLDVQDSAYLVEFWEQRYIHWRGVIGLLRRAVNDPTFLNSNQLDWLAPFFGWSGDYWSKDWTRQQKLDLILNTFQGVRIWDNKGSEDVVTTLFRIFNLPFVLRPQNGFIVNVSIVGIDKIGGSQWNWELLIPKDATPYQTVMAEWIVKYFTPFWARVTIIKRT